MTQTQPSTTRPSRPFPSAPVLTGAPQLLAVLPQLVGFVPRRSAVLVLADVQSGAQGRTLAAVEGVVRVDLPRAEDAAELTRQLVATLTQRPGSLLHLYLLDCPEGLAAELVGGTLSAAAAYPGLVLDEALLVEGSWFRRLRRHGEVVVDGSWEALPATTEVPAAAELVLRGQAALASREELVRLVEGRDLTEVARLDRALAVVELDEDPDLWAGLAGVADWVVHGGPEPADEDVAAATLLMEDRGVRDALLGRWLPELFGGEEDEGTLPAELPAWEGEDRGCLHRLLSLQRRLHPERAVPWTTLTAALAWGRGEGALANVCVDHALEIDPGYRLAQLLEQALVHGLDPRRVADARAAGEGGTARAGSV